MTRLKEIADEVVSENISDMVNQNENNIREIYYWMMRLNYKMQQEGVLEFQCDAGLISRDYPMCKHVTEFVELVCDGADADFIDEMMIIQFKVCKYSGIDALLYYLNMRSLLMIQDGVSARLLEEFFNSVTCGSIVKFHMQRDIVKVKHKEAVKDWLSMLTMEEKEQLEDMSGRIMNLTNDELAIICGNNGFYELDRIIPLLDKAAQDRIHSKISDYRFYYILDNFTIYGKEEFSRLVKDLNEFIADMHRKGTHLLDCINEISDKELNMILKDIDIFTMATALKGEEQQIRDKIYRNLTPELRLIVQEKLAYMGPVCIKDIEDAQKNILKMVSEKDDIQIKKEIE